MQISQPQSFQSNVGLIAGRMSRMVGCLRLSRYLFYCLAISSQLAAHILHAATHSSMSPMLSQLEAHASQIFAQSAQTDALKLEEDN